MMREAMSCRGMVSHIRRAPKRHAFRYPVWMLCVPLERVGRQAGVFPRWLASVDRGHLMTPEEARAKLESVGLAENQTERMRIFALTQPRSLGFSFNPVNFYFCFAGERLVALLADINNTPWDERYCYVLLPAATDRRPGSLSFRFAKRFHVSPFLPMDGNYVLRLKISEGSLRMAMRFDGGDAPFSACLSLETRPLTRASALRSALARPGQGALTLARIYWQAARLLLKRAPFHAHPAKAPRTGKGGRMAMRKAGVPAATESPGDTGGRMVGSG